MAEPKGQYTKHPCVYISKEGEPTLLILTHFFRDYSLPKWKKISDKFFENEKKKRDSKDGETEPNMTEESWRIRSSRELERFYRDNEGNVTSVDNSARRDGYYRAMGKAISMTVTEEQKQSWFGRMLTAIFNGRKDPLKTFDEIKKTVQNETLPTTEQMEKTYKGILNLIDYLKKIGQTDQANEYKNVIDILAAEKTLIAAGYTKFITAKEVIDFMLKSDKGVMIDFLRSYRGILPIRVAEIKKKVDELCVFDNYVVLSYDTSVEKFKFIKNEAREAQRRRDPILFGMIDGSERLYYVADWVTKDDDLTLEHLEKLIGRRAYDIKTQKINGVNAFHDDLARSMEELERNMTNLGF